MKIHILLPLPPLPLLLLVVGVVVEVGARISGGFETNPENLYSVDTCNMEMVNLTCPLEVMTSEPRVILVREAKYGRMKLGRCVQRDLGYLGCSDDATRILDSRCSGRGECLFSLPDPQLHSLKSCPKDVTPYLHVQYTCVTVIPRKSSSCFTAESINVSKESRYLSNYVAGSGGDIHIQTINNNNNNDINNNRKEHKSEDEQRCYFVIEADPGQQINITLFNFLDTQEFSHKSNSSQASNSEIQPPVFSYSPNYHDIQGFSGLTASGNSKGRLARRALVNISSMEEKKVEREKDEEEKEEEKIDDSMLYDTKSHKNNSTRSPPKSKHNPAKVKTNIEEKSRAIQPPQTMAQVGLYPHSKPNNNNNNHHHHLQKARICIEVAYTRELQADKIFSNSRSRRNVTKDGSQLIELDLSNRTIETRSSGHSVDESDFHGSNISHPSRLGIKRRRRGAERKSISICEDDPRIIHVFLSRGSRIGVELRNQPQLMRGRQGTFVMKFEAVGCKHPPPVPGAWFHRHGDSLSVTCNHSSDVTYHVTCKNGKWFGQMGNCSQSGKSILKLNQKSTKEDYFPFGILIMVVVGVAIGIVVGGMFLCLVVACTKNCSSPTNLHTAAEYQSILVNNSTLSTTTTANNKMSDQQQKQQNGARSGNSNWSGVVSDYYPALNQQPTLALSDYNCFRDAGYADALHQTVTRSTDDTACLQDHHHHHHHHLHHLPSRHHQDQLTVYPKCCSFNPDGLFDENLILCDTESIDCRQPPITDVTTAATKSPASTATTRATPFKTFKNPFCQKRGSPVGKIFGIPATSTQVGVSESLLGDQQCCLGCRESAKDGSIVGDAPCSLCSDKGDANSTKKPCATTYYPVSFHLQNEPLKPDVTHLNN